MNFDMDPWVANRFVPSAGLLKRAAVDFRVSQEISIGLKIEVTLSAFLNSIEGRGEIVVAAGIRTF